MEQQRTRSRAAQEKEVIAAVEETVPTRFIGFDLDEAEALLLQVVRQENQAFAIVDRSPLYAEMGGQVSDTGEVVLPGGEVVPVQGVS